MPRYIIRQTEEGVWIITNSPDLSLAWTGSHWYPLGEAGPPVTSFESRAAAERYARKILGGTDE
jgi:hypothetical protein